jgi:adenine-specific DNA-methyltransferase
MHHRLAQLVDVITATKLRIAVAATENDRNQLESTCKSIVRQIDAIVYELYGLTGEEITLVEAAV